MCLKDYPTEPRLMLIHCRTTGLLRQHHHHIHPTPNLDACSLFFYVQYDTQTGLRRSPCWGLYQTIFLLSEAMCNMDSVHPPSLGATTLMWKSRAWVKVTCMTERKISHYVYLCAWETGSWGAPGFTARGNCSTKQVRPRNRRRQGFFFVVCSVGNPSFCLYCPCG